MKRDVWNLPKRTNTLRLDRGQSGFQEILGAERYELSSELSIRELDLLPTRNGVDQIAMLTQKLLNKVPLSIPA